MRPGHDPHRLGRSRLRHTTLADLQEMMASDIEEVRAVTAIQRAVLKPTGQGAAGAKRKRRK